MIRTHANRLTALGFTEKESLVYVAALALGPSPVQRIAERAGVKRATTYVMIERLASRGLVSTEKRGKKKLFSAAPPEAILSHVDRQKEEVEARRRVCLEVLPELERFCAMAAAAEAS